MSGAAGGHHGKDPQDQAAEESHDSSESTEKLCRDLSAAEAEAQMLSHVQTPLQRMFAYVLYQVHGSKFDEEAEFTFSDFMQAIIDCAGCKLENVILCAKEERSNALEQFCADRQLQKYCAFHGTTFPSATNICKHGINGRRCQTGAWGKGFYLANSREGTIALLYADTDDDPITNESRFAVLVCCVAGPASPNDMIVGSSMQRDFGLLRVNGETVLDAAGKAFSNHLLTDPSKTIFCVNDRAAVMPTHLLEFSYDLQKPPSDNALKYAWFPYRVWEELKLRYPDTVARKHALRKKRDDVRALWQRTFEKVRELVRKSQVAGGEKKQKLT